MSDSQDALSDFVTALRRITETESNEGAIVRKVAPLAMELAKVPGLVTDAHRKGDEAQGFSLHMLHEEDDHSNAVFLFSWLPGRGTPAHNHRTWGVVVGIEGEETETWWRRVDDGSRPGYADLERSTERALVPGGTSSFLSDDIHTVWNNTDRLTLSLHVYGKHINYTDRSEFDPDAKTEKAYVLNVE